MIEKLQFLQLNEKERIHIHGIMYSFSESNVRLFVISNYMRSYVEALPFAKGMELER